MNPKKIAEAKKRYVAPTSPREEVLRFWRTLDLEKISTYALISAKEKLLEKYKQFKKEPPRAIDFE